MIFCREYCGNIFVISWQSMHLSKFVGVSSLGGCLWMFRPSLWGFVFWWFCASKHGRRLLWCKPRPWYVYIICTVMWTQTAYWICTTGISRVEVNPFIPYTFALVCRMVVLYWLYTTAFCGTLAMWSRNSIVSICESIFHYLVKPYSRSTLLRLQIHYPLSCLISLWPWVLLLAQPHIYRGNVYLLKKFMMIGVAL